MGKYLIAMVLIMVPVHAGAECRFENVVDTVTLSESQMVTCTTSDNSIYVGCTDSGSKVMAFFTSEFIGGDNTSVTLRGDAQEHPTGFQADVMNNSVGFSVPSHRMNEVAAIFSESSTVFVRYRDYRNVSHDMQIDATGFQEAGTRLSCFTPEDFAPPAPATEQEGVCTNTCQFAFDGECDDGGVGSVYAICEVGSDCSDCGSRANAIKP
jgi:hypothetical protein